MASGWNVSRYTTLDLHSYFLYRRDVASCHLEMSQPDKGVELVEHSIAVTKQVECPTCHTANPGLLGEGDIPHRGDPFHHNTAGVQSMVSISTAKKALSTFLHSQVRVLPVPVSEKGHRKSESLNRVPRVQLLQGETKPNNHKRSLIYCCCYKCSSYTFWVQIITLKKVQTPSQS